MDLNQIYRKTFDELKSFGIPVNEASVVEANFTQTAAKCERDPANKKFKISFMKKLVNSDNEKELRKAMAHELLHTCADTWSHDSKWKEYALIAEKNGHYGLFEAYDLDALFNPEKPILSTFYCPECGVIYESRKETTECNCPWCNKKMIRVLKKDK